MEVQLADGSKVACENQPFAEGGDGILYLALDGQHVIKLYKHAEPWRRQVTEAILNQYNAVKEHRYWEPLFAWPNAVVLKPRLGIQMNRIVGQQPLANFVNYKYRMQRLTPAERGTWQGYVAGAIKVARLMRRLHNLGLCHSDLSENNIFINPVSGQVTLLDCDCLVVPGFLPAIVAGTKGYMAPELMDGLLQGKAIKPSIQTDLHALAVILYRMLLILDPLRGPKQHHPDSALDDLLMYGADALFIEHPTDQSNRPRMSLPSIALLGPDMQKLVLQAFVDGLHNPERRPSAALWERELLRMYDRIVPCENPDCDFKAFVLLEQPQCPWCGTKLSHPPTLPLLQLYRKVGKSWARDGNYTIAGNGGRTLHVWHTNPAKTPGPETDNTVLAHIHYEPTTDTWYLVNHTLNALQVVSSPTGSQPVAPHARIALSDGQQILFGDPDSSRVAFVQFQRVV